MTSGINPPSKYAPPSPRKIFPKGKFTTKIPRTAKNKVVMKKQAGYQHFCPN